MKPNTQELISVGQQALRKASPQHLSPPSQFVSKYRVIKNHHYAEADELLSMLTDVTEELLPIVARNMEQNPWWGDQRDLH